MAKDYRTRALFAFFLSTVCAVIVLGMAGGAQDGRWRQSYGTLEPEMHAFTAEAFTLWSKYCTSRNAEALAEQCELWRRAKDVQTTRIVEEFWWALQWNDLNWAKWAVAGTITVIVLVFAMLPEEHGESKRMEKKKGSAKGVDEMVVDAATQSSS